MPARDRRSRRMAPRAMACDSAESRRPAVGESPRGLKVGRIIDLRPFEPVDRDRGDDPGVGEPVDRRAGRMRTCLRACASSARRIDEGGPRPLPWKRMKPIDSALKPVASSVLSIRTSRSPSRQHLHVVRIIIRPCGRRRGRSERPGAASQPLDQSGRNQGVAVEQAGNPGPSPRAPSRPSRDCRRHGRRD